MAKSLAAGTADSDVLRVGRKAGQAAFSCRCILAACRTATSRVDARIPAHARAVTAGPQYDMLIELGKQGYRLARRISIAVIGGTVVLVGIVMLVTPGPALLVIPIGLAILAVEFAWARHWLNRLKNSMSREQLNELVARGRRFGIRGGQPPTE